MTARNDLPSHGSTSNGRDFGRHSCPDGEIVKTLYGRSADVVDQICARCTDGTELGCYGGNGGYPWSRDGPFNSITGKSVWLLDNILGAGGVDSISWADNCPAGKYVTGIRGRAADVVDNIGFECGIDKKQHCIDHLEDPVCNNISVDILNKACATNMSATCKNRKNELQESTIAGYCPAHLDDPFCSCYKPAPSFIPAEIRGLTNCWNQTCATSGYIPTNMRQVCPSICIARQDVGTSGNSNILTGNINVQDSCNTTVNTGAPKPPAGRDNTGSGNQTGQGSVDWSALNQPNQDNTLLYILIVVLAAVAGYFAFGANGSAQGYPPPQGYPSPYPQPGYS